MARIKRFVSNPKYLIALTSLLASPIIASAATIPTTCSGLVTFIDSIAKTFAAVIFALAVIMFLYAAFLFLTGGGNEETTKKARSYLIYAVIGLIVALFAFNLPGIIRSTIGGDTFNCT